MSIGDANTHDLLVRGIAAAKSKEPKEARFYLEWLLRLDPKEEVRSDALFWLSEVSSDPVEQRGYLEDILSFDQGEPRARRKLAILDGKLDPAEIVDPNRLAQPEAGGTAASTADRFTCPQCGGRMTYTPDGHSLTCDYCEARQHMDRVMGTSRAVSSDDFLVAMATASGHLKPAAMHTFTCQGCGAIFILPPGQLSACCPYCQSSYVVKQTELRDLFIPDGLVPFGISEERAMESLRAWQGSRSFKIEGNALHNQALYLPVWSFFIDGEIGWRCEKLINRIWIEVKDVEPILFDNILVPATDRLLQAFTPAIRKYDLSRLEPYDDRYLAGVVAESYRVPVADASLDARQAILVEVRQSLLERLASQIRDLVLNSSRVRVESFKLVLVPAWLTHFQDGERQVEVLINGQNGDVYSTVRRKLEKRVDNRLD